MLGAEPGEEALFSTKAVGCELFIVCQQKPSSELRDDVKTVFIFEYICVCYVFQHAYYGVGCQWTPASQRMSVEYFTTPAGAFLLLTIQVKMERWITIVLPRYKFNTDCKIINLLNEDLEGVSISFLSFWGLAVRGALACSGGARGSCTLQSKPLIIHP